MSDIPIYVDIAVGAQDFVNPFDHFSPEDGEGDEPAYLLQEQTVKSPSPDTIDATLAELDRPLAVVDIRSAKKDNRVAEWLAKPQRHFSVGATFDPEIPAEYLTEYAYAEAFDGICYVDETTRARPVESEEWR